MKWAINRDLNGERKREGRQRQKYVKVPHHMMQEMKSDYNDQAHQRASRGTQTGTV